MKTQAELRAYAFGCVSGLVIFISALALVCYAAEIRFQPVSIRAR